MSSNHVPTKPGLLTRKQAHAQDNQVQEHVKTRLLRNLADLFASVLPGQFIEVYSKTKGEWIKLTGTSLNINREYRIADPYADPYADVRKAHAEGKKIEWRVKGAEGGGVPGPWRNALSNLSLSYSRSYEYRVKPEEVTLHVYECTRTSDKTVLIHSLTAPEGKPEYVAEYQRPESRNLQVADWKVLRHLYSIKADL